MTRFAFTAMPASGGGAAAAALVKGDREASDERALRATLRAEGLIALDVRPVKLLDALRAAGSGKNRRTAVRLSDTAWFFQTLAMLLKNSVPIESAMTTMDELAPNERVRSACVEVREALRAGSPLSEAVQRAPGLATPQHIALLKSGQNSGRLDHSAMLIDKSITMGLKLRRTIVSGLIYPAILVFASVIVLWFLATFVIPRFAETLESLGGQLPWQTAFTLKAASVLMWVIPPLIVVGVVLWRVRKSLLTPPARMRLHEWLLRLPVIGPLMWNSQGAMVSDTLATMIEGGADVLSALGQAEDVATSPVVSARIGRARRQVREGIELGRAFREAAVLPPTAQAVVQIGMRSGDLVSALRQATSVCADHQERVTQRLLTLLEPAVIVLLAGSVGWVVYSLVSGMLAINQLGTSL